MFKIQTFNAISVTGLERFSRDKYEVASDMGSPDAIMLRSHKLSPEEIGDSVLAIGRAGAGVNNVPVSVCTERGIPVFNTPGANANAVKELILAGMLLGSRGILEGINYVNTLGDMTDHKEMSVLLEKEKKRFKGSEIQGKTLGVVGLGAIGSKVAKMGLRLGMNVVGYDPAISIEAAWRLPAEVEKMENLNSLLAKSDYITLHVPAIEATRNLINDDAIASMKQGARLLNFAREEIVETAAVVKGLESGKLGRYIADFPNPDLLGKPGMILMPHIGASTSEAEDNCAVMAANQLKDFLENGNIKNSVNFPAIKMEPAGQCRLAISNRNVPKVLGDILAVLAEQNINVVDMSNRSRDDIAYSLIDLESRPSDDAVGAIEALDDVIQVRVLCNS